MEIVKSIPSHHHILTEITKASKAYWGYSLEQLEIWKDDLTITLEYIEQNQVFNLIDSEKIIGYYSFYSEKPEVVKLDNLFLLPNYIGKGFGKILVEHFFEQVGILGYKKVTLDSEVFAKDFYLKAGFKEIGRKESSIPGRFLPVMEIEL